MVDPAAAQIADMQNRLDAHVRGLWLLAKMQGGRVLIPAALARQLPKNPQVLVANDPATGGVVVQAL